MKPEKEDFAFIIKKDGTIDTVPCVIKYAEIPEDIEFDVGDLLGELVTDLPVSK